MTKKFLSVREMAAKLDVRLLTAYSLLWDGSVHAEKEDGVWRIPLASVEAYDRKRSARLRSRSELVATERTVRPIAVEVQA